MSGRHYDKFIGDNQRELNLQEYLAIDRTLLANERSFLAFTRTAVTLFIAAISLIKLFDNQAAHILGEVFLAGSVVIFFQGVIRHHATERVVNELEHGKKESIDSPNVALKFLRFSHDLVRSFYR